jgi:2,4-dienoyl-CoA reductase-like NADH-dependent reductase (Old Yellow Enzyme family)
VPYVEGWPIPEALDKDGMQRILTAFARAARRAARIGFEVVELHAAHGYLLHEFLSPIANRRTDSYGGNLEKRMRFPLEVVNVVREALPGGIILGVRITGTDWLEGGLTLDDAVVFAHELRSLGAGYACVSSGGITRAVEVPVEPGYQVPLAERIKKESGIATRTVGMIFTPEQAEDIISSGKADMVCMARAFLDNPRWVWHASEKLGASIQYPPQYARAQRSVWPVAEVIRPIKK